jgi:hypothetical protein
MSIGHRWAAHRRNSYTSNWEQMAIQFAENERILQKQECAEAVRRMGYGGTAVHAAVLAAGTDKPQNPFGCQCGWERERERPDALWMFWLRHKGGIHLDHQCDCCPKCGAKRRDK